MSSPSGQTTEVYLSIQNPVRIEDQGDWTVDDVYTQVREQVEFTSEERKSIEQAVLSDKKQAGFEALKSALNEHGYDGIVYKNKYEDKGSDSYIAFRPGQVKSAENVGTFDPESSSVLALAPTAQGSEQLVSAGPFAEGESMDAPKSIAIVRDLQKVLHQARQSLLLANPHLPGPSMANAAVFSHRQVTFLPVHLVAATDPHHQDTQHIVLNIANHAAIPYPIPP